jgi:hypothetical protein
VAKGRLPLELATTVLAQVELVENLLVLDHFDWQCDLEQRVRGPVAHRQYVHGEINVGDRRLSEV